MTSALYTVANRQSHAALLSLKDNPASNVIEVKKSGLDSEVEVTSYVAEVASRLNGRVVALSSALGQSLEDQIPELRGDAALVELLGTSVEGNVDTVLHALRYDIAVERVEAPTAALEYARRLAQRGVPVNALVRAYRLGQRQINEVVFAELRVIDIPEAMRVEVIEAITGTLFEYIDWMSQQVVAVYEDERERWLENQNSLRGLRVREVLTANKTIDMDAAITSIRYPLRWHHLALVMWYPDPGAEGDELARLQKFLRELGEAAGAAGNPLFVAADRSCGWGWLPYRGVVADAVVKVRQFTLDATEFTERGDWHDGRRRRRLSPLTPGGGGSPRRRDRQRAAQFFDADGDRRLRSGAVRGGASWWRRGRYPRLGGLRAWRPCHR